MEKIIKNQKYKISSEVITNFDNLVHTLESVYYDRSQGKNQDDRIIYKCSKGEIFSQSQVGTLITPEVKKELMELLRNTEL